MSIYAEIRGLEMLIEVETDPKKRQQLEHELDMAQADARREAREDEADDLRRDDGDDQ